MEGGVRRENSDVFLQKGGFACAYACVLRVPDPFCGQGHICGLCPVNIPVLTCLRKEVLRKEGVDALTFFIIPTGEGIALSLRHDGADIEAAAGGQGEVNMVW